MSQAPREFRSKGPELLLELAQQVAEALVELIACEKPLAEQIGHEVANRMVKLWGGQMIYFPQGMRIELNKRDQEIWDAFKGSNHGELARSFGVTVQWIYSIVKYKRAEEIAKRQPRLPGFDGDDDQALAA